jgi:hypothetical protein
MLWRGRRRGECCKCARAYSGREVAMERVKRHVGEEDREDLQVRK